MHLVAQHAAEADPLIRDFLQWVQELGKLYKRSPEHHRVFKEVVLESQSDHSPSASIKPLCPTRGLCRHPAVLSVVEQYEVILQSLYKMANSGPGETAVKACGLHDQFSAGTTLLGLHIAMCVTAPLHELN